MQSDKLVAVFTPKKAGSKRSVQVVKDDDGQVIQLIYSRELKQHRLAGQLLPAVEGGTLVVAGGIEVVFQEGAMLELVDQLDACTLLAGLKPAAGGTPSVGVVPAHCLIRGAPRRAMLGEHAAPPPLPPSLRRYMENLREITQALARLPHRLRHRIDCQINCAIHR